MKTLNKVIILASILSAPAFSSTPSNTSSKMTEMITYTDCMRFTKAVTSLHSQASSLDNKSKTYPNDLTKLISKISDEYQIDQVPLFDMVTEMTVNPEITTNQLNKYFQDNCNVAVTTGELVDDRNK